MGHEKCGLTIQFEVLNHAAWASQRKNISTFKSLVRKERWREYISVNDVADYHCQTWKCVMNNKGLRKQKKKKNF